MSTVSKNNKFNHLEKGDKNEQVRFSQIVVSTAEGFTVCPRGYGFVRLRASWQGPCLGV
jgi:hypothetical protein